MAGSVMHVSASVHVQREWMGGVGWDGFGYIICTLLVEFVVFGGLDV